MKKDEVSVVIICRNASQTIAKAIESALLISDDVVVVDSGSNDGTIEIIQSLKAKFLAVAWQGYGFAKNAGITSARHKWIFSLDADECIDHVLAQAINQFHPIDETDLAGVKRLNYLGRKPIHFGEWRNDFVLRLFNKDNTSWDASPVHEQLIHKVEGRRVKLNGVIHHYTSPDINTYKLKLEKYAQLMAEKYFIRGKKAKFFKIYFSPILNFIQNYIVRGGFLDGKGGWQIAMCNAGYSYRKYKLLQNKWRKAKV